MGESFIIIIHEEIHFEEVTQPPEPPWVTLEPDKMTKQKKWKFVKEKENLEVQTPLWWSQK